MSHWPCVKRLAHTVGLSTMQALKYEREESETITAMAELSMQPPIVKRWAPPFFDVFRCRKHQFNEMIFDANNSDLKFSGLCLMKRPKNPWSKMRLNKSPAAKKITSPPPTHAQWVWATWSEGINSFGTCVNRPHRSGQATAKLRLTKRTQSGNRALASRQLDSVWFCVAPNLRWNLMWFFSKCVIFCKCRSVCVSEIGNKENVSIDFSGFCVVGYFNLGSINWFVNSIDCIFYSENGIMQGIGCTFCVFLVKTIPMGCVMPVSLQEKKPIINKTRQF